MRRVAGRWLALAFCLIACGNSSIGDEPDGIPLPERDPNQQDAGSQVQGANIPPTPPAPSSFTLSVSLTGTGKGAIASTPTGLACVGTKCTGTFPAGAQVALSATPDSGSILGAWSGACTGSAACTVTMSADATVGAELTSLIGTWSGSYTNTRQNGGCTFNNAGTLTAKVTATGAALATTANVDGLEIRQLSGCALVGKSTGSAPSSAVTNAGAKMTGTWTFNVAGVGGTLAFPFTGTVSGNTLTGSWTCATCTGTFTLKLQ
jgi:hypothetical protein